MNSIANQPIQLSFFSDSLNAIVSNPPKRRRNKAAEALDQLILDRGWSKGVDYVYANNRTKVSLICSSGHPFNASPKSFKKGFGCPKCSNCCPEQAREEFEQAISDRGFRKGPTYKYVRNSAKVSLICPKGHQFNPTPKIFKKGYGCPKCSGCCPEQAREEFEQLVRERGFSKGVGYKYVNSKTVKVSLMCPRGHQVRMIPSDFKSGYGCLKCSGCCPEQARKEFDRLIVERGFNKGPDFIYVNYKTRVPLICEHGHHFKINPNSFKHGKGCPGCRMGRLKSGFNQCLPAALYYIVFYPQPSRAVYKIGITNRTADDRYRYCRTPYQILMEKHFESGADCFDEEIKIIRKYRDHRCKDEPVDGLKNKELFDIDVLGLDFELHPPANISAPASEVNRCEGAGK
jgi:hypothetical protein